jgi:hypothetical protein
LKEFTKDIKYENGRLILSESLIAGDYKLFDWKTGRRVSISLIEPQK